VLDAQLHLLDRQILDQNEVPVTTVDDIEISDIELDSPLNDRPAPIILNFLTGPVLGTRIFGGRPPPSRWEKIPWSCVAEVDTVITLGIAGETLTATWTERWVRDHIIRRIPGAGHDPE
jgi:hypothetical protein